MAEELSWAGKLCTRLTADITGQTEDPQRRSWHSGQIPEASGLLGPHDRDVGYAGRLEQTPPALHAPPHTHTGLPHKVSRGPGDTEDGSQADELLSHMPL